ncbi:helix-turn-helix domain-containing protein [Streptomyces sp. NPDC002992]|uniref:winged helix-turn-helix transcriptional regulator n=1 Tax=Streptomyces sp. NPDC002992 TaxID=3154273 RepID=UPI0033B0F82F
MAAARVPSTDLPRVVETLEMIAPRWSVWVIMTLAAETQPMRYSEVNARLPWLVDGQLTPRLRALSNAGLIERTAFSRKHVTYGLTDRGRALLPTLEALAAYGDQHLDKQLVETKVTKNGTTQVEMLPERIPAAQNAEDALVLISYKHATPLLWALEERGPSTMAALHQETMPDLSVAAVYHPVYKLSEDRLVTITPQAGADKDTLNTARISLTAAARSLAPVYQTVAAWATGRPHTDAGIHPLWGANRLPAAARSGQWAAHQARHTMRTAVPVAQPPAPAPAKNWRPADLFSSPTTGPCR